VRKNYDDEIFAEPDPPDANTDEGFEDEVFQYMQSRGEKLEDLEYPPDRRAYQKWLSNLLHVSAS
jgi:hypothetical protein